MMFYTPVDLSNRQYVLYILLRTVLIVAVGLCIIVVTYGSGFAPLPALATTIAAQLLFGRIFDYVARIWHRQQRRKRRRKERGPNG